MSNRVEFDYYIPPDVVSELDSDGTIPDASWPDVYQFSNDVDSYLLSFTGMGMPPINYITQTGPYQHGSSVLDYRLGTRVIQLVHRRTGKRCDRRQGYWTARADVLNLLRPNRQLAGEFERGRLRKVQPDGTVRDVNVLIEQGPLFTARNPEAWDEWSFTEAIRFVAHNPTFFDPEQQSLSWTIANIGNLIFYESPDWEDRMVFPITFGISNLFSTLSMTYTGTWLSYPVVTISGPLNDFLLLNQTIDEKIQLDYNIGIGETVVFDLSFGNKTVISSTAGNIIGSVTTDSDLATFRLAPDPEAPGGVNDLYLFGGGGAVGITEAIITWHVRYIGI